MCILSQMKAPLTENELDMLVLAIDFKGSGKIEYCLLPKVLKCYGGGLQEMINSGLERVMGNHRQVGRFN